MRRLILFRHAKAEAKNAGKDDFDRALTARGREDAALVGEALARQDFAPDLALVSPSRRTTETWTCARGALPDARVELVPSLYNGSPDAIRAAVDEAAGRCESLAVVGHNPALHEFAVDLLIEAAAARAEIERIAARFPTSSAAVYAIDAAGRASLERLLLARELGGEGDG